MTVSFPAPFERQGEGGVGAMLERGARAGQVAGVAAHVRRGRAAQSPQLPAQRALLLLELVAVATGEPRHGTPSRAEQGRDFLEAVGHVLAGRVVAQQVDDDAHGHEAQQRDRDQAPEQREAVVGGIRDVLDEADDDADVEGGGDGSDGGQDQGADTHVGFWPPCQGFLAKLANVCPTWDSDRCQSCSSYVDEQHTILSPLQGCELTFLVVSPHSCRDFPLFCLLKVQILRGYYSSVTT